MSDLRKLIEALEGQESIAWGFGNGFARSALGDLWEVGMAADLNCLDAARELHEALLPDWNWQVWSDGAEVWPKAGDTGDDAVTNMKPARAWLLAILNAYEATR